MRDNHDGLPEIVDAIEQDGQYFGFVQLEREGKQKRFRFGVSRDGYLTLKHVLQLRPFDQMPGARYRYFFVPNVQRLEGERMKMAVRVERGKDGKQLDAEARRDLVANLMWFYELDDLAKAEYVAVTATHPDQS